MNESYDGFVVVGPSGVQCSRCGNEKTKVKKKRTDGKGWRHWLRCEACIERIEQDKHRLVGGKGKRAQWRVTVDGEEYNQLIAQFGGAREYNKAKNAALKANPLLAALEFKACPACGKCMTCTEEVRHDRGGATRFRWECIPCRHQTIAACTRRKLAGSAEPTEKGKLIMMQRGLSTAEKRRAALERSRKKKVASKGWNKNHRIKYGLSQEDYIAMLEKQNYKCAMPNCKFVHRYEEWFALPPNRNKRGEKVKHHHLDYLLVVDHCHDTGAVRALLCRDCNFAIGTIETALRRGIYVWGLARYTQEHNIRIANAQPQPNAVLHCVDEGHRHRAG